MSGNEEEKNNARANAGASGESKPTQDNDGAEEAFQNNTHAADVKAKPARRKYIYLDNAASESDGEMDVTDDVANPNSVHDAGRDGFKMLEKARESIARNIGAARPSEVIFTSGATEANNSAIFGIAREVARQRGFMDKYGVKDRERLPKVITSAIEHDSVLKPVQELEERGFDVVVLPVDNCGFVQLDDLCDLLDDRTVLVCIQIANTEIGSVQDIAPMIKATHDAGAFFHTDAVGAFGKIPFSVAELGVDSASFSGHKVGSAKGIGALYLRAGTPFKPLVYGSGQEGSRRSGTQNAAGAASMAKALERCMSDIYSLSDRMARLRNYLYEQVNGINGVRLTVPQAYRNIHFLPNICHILFPGHSSQEVVIYMNKRGIQVSGGPACSSVDAEGKDGEVRPSHVLTAIGVAEEDALSSVRVSFGFHTTRRELDELIAAIIEFTTSK